MRTQTATVVGRDGLRGTLLNTAQVDDPRNLTALVSLDNGQDVWVPVSLLERDGDGYRIPFGYADLTRQSGDATVANRQSSSDAAPIDTRVLGTPAPSGNAPRPQATPTPPPAPPSAPRPEAVVPVVEEQAEFRKRRVETGVVRVAKTVEEHEQVVDEPLYSEEVEVTRVPVNRVVDGPIAIREEGDTTVIPVLEEVLVVEKRLMLREEVHVRKRRTERHEPQRVPLRREEVQVERHNNEA